MPDCFVIMPISTPAARIPDYGNDARHFDHVYELLFVPAIQQINYTPIPPSASGSDVIHAEIIRRLETADLVMCDISTLNANVFFELGIRTAVDKPVCLVRDTLTTQIPFDATLINFHQYDHALAAWQLDKEIEALASHLLAVVNRSENRNTLWRYFGLSTRAQREGEEQTAVESKLDIILSRLEGSEAARESDQMALAALSDPVQALIKEAQVIASEVNARLKVAEIAGSRIVLDPGSYGIDDNRKLRIRQMGQRLGFAVAFASDASQIRRPRQRRTKAT